MLAGLAAGSCLWRTIHGTGIYSWDTAEHFAAQLHPLVDAVRAWSMLAVPFQKGKRPDFTAADLHKPWTIETQAEPEKTEDPDDVRAWFRTMAAAIG